MKALLNSVLIVSLVLVNAFSAQAGTKGIQAVLLQGWSDQSVEKLLSVVENDQMKKKTFEISFCPFLLSDSQLPVHTDPRWICKFWPTDPNDPKTAQKPAECNNTQQTVPNGTSLNRGRFDNIIMLIDRLLAKGVVVKVRVHLSFHSSDSTSSEKLKERAETVNKVLFKPYADVVAFSFSPMLEDNYSSSTVFTERATALLSKLDYGKLSTRRHRVLRSIIPDKTQEKKPTSVKVKNPSDSKKSVSLSVVHESHTTTYSSYNIWSNDGMFVYRPDTEDKDCTANANDKFPTKYSVSDFTKKANSFSRSTLLWRPAYNLFNRDSDKERAYGKRCYAKNSLASRSDDGKFDDNEASVLKQFLGLK